MVAVAVMVAVIGGGGLCKVLIWQGKTRLQSLGRSSSISSTGELCAAGGDGAAVGGSGSGAVATGFWQGRAGQGKDLIPWWELSS